MEDKKNTTQINTEKSVVEIDLGMLLRDFLRSFSKMWWLTLILAVLFAIGALLYSMKSYEPMYKAEATFTVETYNPTQSGYTFFYDNHTAAQMALTFPAESHSVPEQYRHLYMAGAFYNVFIEWLKNGQRESCYEIARLCASLTTEGCHPHFTKGNHKK